MNYIKVMPDELDTVCHQLVYANSYQVMEGLSILPLALLKLSGFSCHQKEKHFLHVLPVIKDGPVVGVVVVGQNSLG